MQRMCFHPYLVFLSFCNWPNDFPAISTQLPPLPFLHSPLDFFALSIHAFRSLHISQNFALRYPFATRKSARWQSSRSSANPRPHTNARIHLNSYIHYSATGLPPKTLVIQLRGFPMAKSKGERFFLPLALALVLCGLHPVAGWHTQWPEFKSVQVYFDWSFHLSVWCFF